MIQLRGLTVIIEEKDFESADLGKGEKIDNIIIPTGLKDKWNKSPLRTALLPCLNPLSGKILTTNFKHTI